MRWTDKNLIPAGQYLKLQQGENRIRIVSEVEVYGKHYDRENKKITICIGRDEGCKECEKGNKPKPSWLCWVIDRADGKYKLLEVGYTIIKQIQTLARSKEYGFDLMPNYDVTVVKEGEGLQTEYTVIASRQDSKLTDEQMEEVMNLESPKKIIAEKKGKIIEDTELEPF